MHRRLVSSNLRIQVSAPAQLVFSVAVSAEHEPAQERLSLTVGGDPIDVEELLAPNGGRLHRAVNVPVGQLIVDYSATIDGQASPAPLQGIDEVLYTRPSRYCDSDRLAALSGAHFDGLEGSALVSAVRAWVHDKIAYRSGSSRGVDGALDTYIARAGVCRDFSHLAIAFLRARNVPARFVSVYAPGLKPMDFHAVTEVWLDGAWQLFDATGLAPRQAMVRICTGRDAADTAFMTTLGGRTQLESVRVEAQIDGDLPSDDGLGLSLLS